MSWVEAAAAGTAAAGGAYFWAAAVNSELVASSRTFSSDFFHLQTFSLKTAIK